MGFEDARQVKTLGKMLFSYANCFFPFLTMSDRYSDWTYIRKKKGAGVIDLLCINRKR